MISKAQRRTQIIRRISQIPKDKLEELDEYISKLEKDKNNKKKTLSYAGAWQDIEDLILQNEFMDRIKQNNQLQHRSAFTRLSYSCSHSKN